KAVLDPGDGVRLVAAVIDVIDVPHARAAGAVVGRAVAGIAISAAGLVQEEASPDARRVQAYGRVDVGDGLARVGDRRIDAVVVHAVAPLVIEDRRDFAGVGTAVARARPEEVDVRAVPERITDVVLVHDGGQLSSHPLPARVRLRQVSARELGLSVELEKAGARGLRVACRMACRYLAVRGRGRRAGAEVDAGGPGLGYG